MTQTVASKILNAVLKAVEEGRTEIPYPNRDNVDWALPETPFAELPGLPPDVLQALGCRLFDEMPSGDLWLFPGEWFNYLPDGLKVVSITGEQYAFDTKTCDPDTRMGLLAYGFYRKKEGKA